ncbi:hypothetical protein ROZALSC1DRAFT_28815 [Rozella allomycis CSF55]|uniref:Uncharacterized protein n=1 Tax=Rozella allomycis (strain CSF55) TaxID=988480 RepID=A0A4V1IZX7_ROZAC|nr:hypothetical protein ROZALSC1DRAFT_28815 [Rozella allomycis CSF55]
MLEQEKVNDSTTTTKSMDLLSSLGLNSPDNVDYDKLEFILEDDMDPSGRLPLGSTLTFGVGITVGSIWGFFEGVKDPAPTTMKLRKNAILNAITKRGPFVANSVGVVSIYYFGLEWCIANLLGLKDDFVLPITSAFTAGALFKASGNSLSVWKLAGLKASGKIGLTCAAGMGVISGLKHLYKNYKFQEEDKMYMN